MRPNDSDIIEQQIFLGGKVSHKYEIFKEIARMSPDWAEVFQLLKKMPEWEKEPNEEKVVLDIVELFGEIDFVRSCTELTVLSMILGDTRDKYKVVRPTGTDPST